jgi:hypothetical protein
MIQNTNPWKDVEWMTQADAQNLRTQQNVINLAYLQAGGAEYSQNLSIIFAPGAPWRQTKPLGMESLSVSGTSIAFSAYGNTYVLNVYQPFTFAENPEKVIVVDMKGGVWQADASVLKTVSVGEATPALPVVVSPNPDLTFSY